MNYYLNEKENEIYAYDNEQVKNGVVKKGLKAITEEEAQSILLQKDLDYQNSDEYKQALIQQQEATKKQLLAEVKEEIEILQDTIDFDEHDDGDEAHLLALKKYRVALNKVDTSVIDCEFPEKPVR